MAKMKAVFARIRLPIFSIKHPETFQVMSCLPIPQPSVLVGALAYCIGTSHGSGLTAYENLKKDIERGEKFTARAKLMDTIVYSSIVLRRFRIADEIRKRTRLYEILARGDIVGGKLFLEKDLMDAFYRGYAMGREILCAWILGENFMIDEGTIRLLQRLGDTESLIAVSDVWIEPVELGAASEIKTSFPFPLGDARIRHGDFTLMKMCNERRLPEQYVIPIRHEVRRTGTGRVMVLEPTEIEVEFPRPTQFCETSMGSIILS